MRPPDPKKVLTKTQQEWFDAVQAILTGGGFRVADQISKPLTFTWNSDHPTKVKTALVSRPLSVLCLGAVKSSDPSTTFSGIPIGWTWDAPFVTVTLAALLNDHTDYTMTILVLS